jgi:aminopeptidase N
MKAGSVQWIKVLGVAAFVISFSGRSSDLSCRNMSSNGHLFVQQDYDQRMDQYDVKFYGINLEVNDTSTFLKGYVDIMLEVLDNPVNELVFDLLSDLSVDSVSLDGISTGFVHAGNQLIVEHSTGLQPHTQVTVAVYYGGLGIQDQWISGIYNTYNQAWDKRITWTLSEPFAALNWFPCKQVLSDKADSAWIFLTTGRHLKAGSNGLLTNTVSLPGNRVRYEWKTRYPIAYYLLSYAVGEYRDYSFFAPLPGGEDSVLVQNYIYDTPAYFDQNKSDIDKTADLIYLFSELFGPYPFRTEKYGHCIAPFGGGMEHQTMTTLGSFDFSLVAHELAHQWFGDLVTCGSWQDIWINEGFASYAEYIALQYLKSQDEADLWMSYAHSYIKSQKDGSVYVPAEQAKDEERIFDYRLSYKKGAAIIHMIRQEVQNDSLFFGILREFLSRYRNHVALGEDFKGLLEEKTGRDFDAFFEQWYYGEGYPTVTVDWKQVKDTLVVYSFLTSSDSNTPLFNILTDFSLTLSSGDSLISRRQEANYDEWKLYMPLRIKNIRLDPDNWLLFNNNGVNNLSSFEKDEKLYLAPNPALNKVTIHFDLAGKDVDIFIVDSSGKTLTQMKADSFPLEMSIGSYSSGAYVVLIKEDERLYSSKFIKN